MKKTRRDLRSDALAHAALALLLASAGHAAAQTYNSGSTGALGALNPAANTAISLPPDGILNYTTVTIPAGVTVTFQPNAANTPVTILATGDVTVDGTINVEGAPGLEGIRFVFSPNLLGGAGGPGGFRGGNGGVVGGIPATNGLGPGGGNASPLSGGASGSGTYAGTSASLLPLFGGSGGGGSNPSTTCGQPCAGPSGAGGGGAILIASSTKIVVAGTLSAAGGKGGATSGQAGAGSGGAIRLVAPLITGAGVITASGGGASCGGCPAGGPGRVRMEAFTLGFAGQLAPALNNGSTQSTTPGPATAASNPALVGLPTLAFASVGGVAAPAVHSGSFAQADMSLQQGATNPVPVVVAATNTPLNATVTLRVVSQSAPATTVTTSLNGNFASSTAAMDVTLVQGGVTIVQAWANMTLTGQIASLFPSIDGEPVVRVTVANLDGRSSTLNLFTRSGKQKRFDELAPLEQLQVAQAWQAMREPR